MQVEPIKPVLNPPGTKRLKLEHEKLLSNFAFNSNLRRYNEVPGSPFSMDVISGDISAANSVPRPNAVLAKYESSIDIQGTFDVAARDAYNNAVDYTGFNIGVWTVAVDVKLPAKAG